MLCLKNRKLFGQKPKRQVQIGYEKSASGFHAVCKNATGCAVKSIHIDGARYNLIASAKVSSQSDPNYGRYVTTVAVAGERCVEQTEPKTIEISDGSAKNHDVILFDRWRTISFNRYYFISFDYEIEPYDDGSVPSVYMRFVYGFTSNPTYYVYQYTGAPVIINPNGESKSSFSIIQIRISYSDSYTGVPLLKLYFNSPSEEEMTGNGRVTVKNMTWSETQGWSIPSSVSDFAPERIVARFYTDEPLGACATAADEMTIDTAAANAKIIKRTGYANGATYALDTPYEMTVPNGEPIMLYEGEPNMVYLKSQSPPTKMTVKYFSKTR